jgi:PAS domain S-box-containing protein
MMSGNGEDLSCDLELAQASQRLSAHIQNSPLAVIEWDRNFKIIRWSGQAEKIFGWRAIEVLGVSFIYDLPMIHAQDVERVLALIDRLHQGKSSSSDLEKDSEGNQDENQNISYIQNRNHTKSGKVIWCEWYNSIILDRSGNVSSVLSLALDISDRIKAVEVSLEYQRRYERLFNCEDDSVVIHGFTPKGLPSKFIEVNDAACKNLGYSRTELLTMSPIDIGDCSKPMRSLVATLFASGKVTFETTHKTKDGRLIPVEVRTHLLENPGEAIAISFARDISDRQLAEQEILYSRNLLSSIFNESTDAIFLVDNSTGLVFDCNSRAIQLFGVENKSDLIGIRGGSLHKYPCTEQEHLKMKQDLESQNFFAFETEYLKQNGEYFWGSMAAKIIKIAKQKINLVRLTDISERKQIELEIIQKNRDLEQARTEAESANSAKGKFLAMMSHEIRTPLGAILGMTELLLTTELSEEQRELTQTMRHSGDILLNVINDVLDLSKIESENLELENQPFSLFNCVAESVRLNTNRANQKQLNLLFIIDPQCPEFFLGDSKRISQVLINLIGNAIKFTDRGEVKLRVSSRLIQPSTELHEVQFSIEDTGIGIPADSFDRLFRPFSQVDASTTRKYGGTGLGLTICKQLCELMGGKIWVESELNRGSIFHFTVQISAIAPSVPILNQDSNKTPSEIPSNIRILLVEDNQVNVRLGQKMLGRLGYATNVVNNGVQAIAAVLLQDYDLVFMDVLMPEMDGLEATRQICLQVPIEKRPWIIAMTANAMEGDRQICLDAGMNDYISKPISLSAISAAIQHWHSLQLK